MTRKSIEAWLEDVEWEPIPRGSKVDSDGLYATHRGILTLPRNGEPFQLRVFTLNDGQRVFDADDFTEYWT